MGCHCGEPEPYCTHKIQEKVKSRTFPDGKIPPFLPQPRDYILSKDTTAPLTGPGPWAFGRVQWTPSAGLTGIRPIVDRYSITRYSNKDWKIKNRNVLDMAINTDKLKENVKCTLDTIVAGADKQQSGNTHRLEERVKLVRACKDEMEQLIKDLREEIVLLTETKIRMKFSLPALKMPESIAGECIERRTTRLEQDLVNDQVEVELVKELAMIKEARTMYEENIANIEKQILANRSCKNQLELTWSDKKETCELESINASLRNNSPIISYYGGAVRLQDSQSSPESWGIYNMSLIDNAQRELKTSRCLREVAEGKLMNTTVQELRDQADKVYNALKKRIDETDACRQMFEDELRDVLIQIAEAESQYGNLLKLQRQLDYNTKVAQTRMNNRQQRPRVENCRDEVQYGLIDEVQYLNASKADLKRQIEEVDKIVSELYKVRSNLEYAITTKRKSLYVDQQRCISYREKYPDVTTLTGGNSL